MALLTIQTQTGDLTAVVSEGTLLSSILQHEGHAPDMPCGGQSRCLKCRVWAAGALSAPSPAEVKGLSPQELSAGIRLACCTKVLGDAQVRLLADNAVSQICTQGAGQAFAPDPMFSRLGAAVDIGTTTLAAQLYDTEHLLATASAPNPQRSFGADVISRVGRSVNGDREELAQCIRQGISALLEDLCRQAGRQVSEIDGMVITGNTAMLHLLTATDISPLAAAPFAVKERFGRCIPAGELDLPCGAEVPVYLPRCMSAFVGADITTALMASGICRSDSTALLADIGTNGEIALWHKGKLSCCSTAAGPAFEGANLSHGMQGAPGAIDHAWVEDGTVAIHTIGEVAPVGICGSGVADVLACLLKLDILDETGLLADDEDEFPLAKGVAFTQMDVRQVQLAKSAVRAGMETLVHQVGLTKGDITRLAIAGGFGSYLSLDSAAAIGLLPPELAPRCDVLGNAALSGAAMLLRSRPLQEESFLLADRAETVDLATNPFFMDQYIEQMMF